MLQLRHYQIPLLYLVPSTCKMWVMCLQVRFGCRLFGNDLRIRQCYVNSKYFHVSMAGKELHSFHSGKRMEPVPLASEIIKVSSFQRSKPNTHWTFPTVTYNSMIELKGPTGMHVYFWILIESRLAAWLAFCCFSLAVTEKCPHRHLPHWPAFQPFGNETVCRNSLRSFLAPQSFTSPGCLPFQVSEGWELADKCKLKKINYIFRTGILFMCCFSFSLFFFLFSFNLASCPNLEDTGH